MTFFIVIGIIACTLAIGWVAWCCFGFALMCLLGFDERNIPVGLVFAVLGVLACTAWWFLIGTHIHLNPSMS